MYPSKFIPITLLPLLCSAILKASPSYINAKQAYKVSTIEQHPKEFSKSIKLTNKQQVLGTSNNTTEISISSGLSLLNSDSNEEAYYVNVTVGPETYQLLIDTGSPYMWLYDSDCTDSSCKDKHLYEEPSSLSSTQTFELAYTTGTASGSVVTDDIGIAGYSLEDFAFGSAGEVPDLFEKYTFNGVLGIPNHNGSSTGIGNIVEAFKDENLIDSAKFALCLGEYDSSLSNSGLLVFGESIDELYDGDIYYTEALENTHNYWHVKITKVFVNDYHVTFADEVEISGQNSTVERLALLDSGTTSITMTSEDAVKIHSFFDNAVTDGSNFAIYCNTTLDIVFEIGGHNWSLASDDYLGDKYPDDSVYAGYCVSNIQGIDATSDGSWILGALFLRTVYTEFNIDESIVGFAERNTNVKIIESISTSSASLLATPASSQLNSFSGSHTGSSYSNYSSFPSSFSTLFLSSSSSSDKSGSASSSSPQNSGSSLSHRSLTSILMLGISFLLL